MINFQKLPKFKIGKSRDRKLLNGYLELQIGGQWGFGGGE